MAKKQSKKKKDFELEERDLKNDARAVSLQEETIRVIYAILFFVASLFLIFSAIAKAGPVGTTTFTILTDFLGIGYYLLPVILLVLGVLFIKSLKQHSVAWPKLVGSLLFLLSSLGIISTLFKDTEGVGQGGFIGNMIASPLYSLFDFWVTLIFLFALLIISTVIVFEAYLSLSRLAFWRKDGDELSDEAVIAEDIDDKKITDGETVLAEKEIVIPEDREEKKKTKKEEKREDGFGIITARLGKPFAPPPLDLLKQDSGKPGVGDIKANANIIKRTLQNFGINVEMDEISIGPSVTRYALKPAEGVKLARIVALQNDLSLALAAHPIRIEAPIPGKSLVGIEIPNSTKTTVGLGTLLGSEEFQQSDKPLLVSLGKGISGKSHFANLAKMPHLLIAGATGSGKSVTIHAIITSLLYRNSPENLKFIMIDPKRVELTQYNNIPHLLTPVITDAKKSILALKWAAKEMDRRYDILENEKVRDIESYHKNILAPALKKIEGKKIDMDEGEDGPKLPETMPYILVIIDELADLMQTYPRELESAIVRLAQMSRAVGIHLMLSTQRPSVNVITGLIKANIPSRIALQVTSQIDSRTILDAAGAEKLLGAGDMLFMSGEMSKPSRIQSAYISENEMKNVVKYLVDNYADELPNEINLGETSTNDSSIFSSSFGDDDGGDEDDLYEEAREIVVSAGKASTSYLQRKLRVGYARAARLIDMLEERGVIGPGEGAKPREVIGAGSRSADTEDDSDDSTA
jgi:S-DNA-T family DNA segregation ATPase FtsK/SpoIIIE